MKTTLISKENNKAKFTLEFSAEEFDAATTKAYKANKDRFSINGFRKGKAPKSIIEKHYGEGIFVEDAINDMFRDNYPVAINDLELDIIDEPQIDFSEIGKGKPLTMTIDVPVFPIFDIKNYKGVAVEETETEVKNEDVDEEIDKLRKRNARIVTADKAAETGDSVILDYSGSIGDKQFEGGTAEMQTLVLGSNTFVPGFEDQLIGAKAGEEKEIKVTFPEEYGAKDLAGKEAVFKCKIHEVKQEELPEADDEFAKDVSEYDTLDELRRHTREDLEKAFVDQARDAARGDLVNKVCDANDIEIPDVMVRDETENMIRELQQQLMYQGLSLDQYMQFTGSDMAKLRDSIKEDALKRVKARVVLISIAEIEGIMAAEEDVDEELKKMAKNYGVEEDKVRDSIGEGMTEFKKDVLIRKVIDNLYEQADVTKVSPEELEKRAAEKMKNENSAKDNAENEDKDKEVKE